MTPRRKSPDAAPKNQTPRSAQDAPPRRATNRYAAAWLFGLLAATALTFSLTFHFGWVYDDPPQIPQNPNLEWSRLGFLFSHQLWASTAAVQARFYRPLLTVWFLINKTIFGLNPHAFHLTTVLAHAAAVTLACFIARSVLKDLEAALFAAAVFALHPLQVESASWISAVNDPLAASLCFASFLAYRKALLATPRRILWRTLAAAFFLLALFAKEVSIVLPGIVLIDAWSNTGSSSASKNAFPQKSTLRVWGLIYSSVAVVWLILRSSTLSSSSSPSSPIPWTTVFYTAPRIILFNLYRAVLPIGLSPQYDFRVSDSPNASFLLGVAALAAILFLAVKAAQRDPRIYPAVGWVILPLLPTLNLRWMNQGDFIHDRYMYLSMMGVALLAGALYEWIRTRWPEQQLVRPLAAALIVILGFASAIQSQFWANDLVLFERSVSIAPNNEWAQLNYGSALSARGKFAEAASHFIRSYELAPGWRAADFAAFCYQQSQDLVQADRWFTTAAQADPAQAAPEFGLGQIRLRQENPQAAIPHLRKALALDPDAEGFHYEMGRALELTNQTSAALQQYQTELQLHPSQAEVQKAIDRLNAATNAR